MLLNEVIDIARGNIHYRDSIIYNDGIEILLPMTLSSDEMIRNLSLEILLHLAEERESSNKLLLDSHSIVPTLWKISSKFGNSQSTLDLVANLLCRMPHRPTIKWTAFLCDLCGALPIVGSRYTCTLCDDFDFCALCYALERHSPNHVFFKYPDSPDVITDFKEPSFVSEIEIKDDLDHIGFLCQLCGTDPIHGSRYQCLVCDGNPNFCQLCYCLHDRNHMMLRYRHPLADTTETYGLDSPVPRDQSDVMSYISRTPSDFFSRHLLYPEKPVWDPSSNNGEYPPFIVPGIWRGKWVSKSHEILSFSLDLKIDSPNKISGNFKFTEETSYSFVGEYDKEKINFLIHPQDWMTPQYVWHGRYDEWGVWGTVHFRQDFEFVFRLWPQQEGEKVDSLPSQSTIDRQYKKVPKAKFPFTW
eukprot:TRINITY_DN8484_c0_g1_i1.p1 TRINITY_DN8484_c0_g1~~TRINITY_DN8484_c0_g1_i1.p1  ORF type:complete len:452 (+),score=40.91 TRINITY_DN8484_c0_g1_i1:114-1358(+)